MSKKYENGDNLFKPTRLDQLEDKCSNKKIKIHNDSLLNSPSDYNKYQNDKADNDLHSSPNYQEQSYSQLPLQQSKHQSDKKSFNPQNYIDGLVGPQSFNFNNEDGLSNQNQNPGNHFYFKIDDQSNEKDSLNQDDHAYNYTLNDYQFRTHKQNPQDIENSTSPAKELTDYQMPQNYRNISMPLKKTSPKYSNSIMQTPERIHSASNSLETEQHNLNYEPISQTYDNSKSGTLIGLSGDTKTVSNLIYAKENENNRISVQGGGGDTFRNPTESATIPPPTNGLKSLPGSYRNNTSASKINQKAKLKDRPKILGGGDEETEFIRNIKQSLRGITKCKFHNQPYSLFCPSAKQLSCIECVYNVKHSNNSRKQTMISIKSAFPLIIETNKYYKVEAKEKIGMIDETVRICQQNWSILQNNLENTLMIINKEFHILQEELKNRQAQLVETITALVGSRIDEIKTTIEDVEFLKNCFKDAKEVDPQQSLELGVHFFAVFNLLKSSMKNQDYHNNNYLMANDDFNAIDFSNKGYLKNEIENFGKIIIKSPKRRSKKDKTAALNRSSEKLNRNCINGLSQSSIQAIPFHGINRTSKQMPFSNEKSLTPKREIKKNITTPDRFRPDKILPILSTNIKTRSPYKSPQKSPNKSSYKSPNKSFNKSPSKSPTTTSTTNSYYERETLKKINKLTQATSSAKKVLFTDSESFTDFPIPYDPFNRQAKTSAQNLRSNKKSNTPPAPEELMNFQISNPYLQELISPSNQEYDHMTASRLGKQKSINSDYTISLNASSLATINPNSSISLNRSATQGRNVQYIMNMNTPNSPIYTQNLNVSNNLNMSSIYMNNNNNTTFIRDNNNKDNSKDNIIKDNNNNLVNQSNYDSEILQMDIEKFETTEINNSNINKNQEINNMFIFHDSLILSPDIRTIDFYSIIPSNLKTAKLIYRLTADGSGSAKFHEKCDNHAPCLVFVKSDRQYIFGYYLSIPFVKEEKYNTCEDSYIFSIKNPIFKKPTKFPIKSDKKFIALYQSQTSPCLGSTIQNKQDLWIK